MRLLELFAPANRSPARGQGGASNRSALPRADAIHRAKNLAQMSTSLANLTSDPAHGRASVEAHARALARTYDELSFDREHLSPVPCLDLLSEVAARLTAIFGFARNISTGVAGNDVMLPPDVRRALILIASELIINALKYGFPGAGSGTVHVTLRQSTLGIEMVVEDDGVGLPGADVPGYGSGLVESFATIAGAIIARRAGAAERGLRGSVRIPVIMVLPAFAQPSARSARLRLAGGGAGNFRRSRRL